MRIAVVAIVWLLAVKSARAFNLASRATLRYGALLFL